MTSLFRAPKPAPIIPPAPMPTPTPDDEAIRQARRRQLAASTARTGRASTILTDNGTTDRLGG